MTKWTLTLLETSQPPRHNLLSRPPRVSTMKAESQRSKGREGVIEALNAAIKVTDLAEKTSCIAPAKIAFGSASILFTLIKVCLPFFCQDLLWVHT